MNIDENLMEKITQKVLDELQSAKIPIEASGRHAHLSREAIDALFGKGYELTPSAELSQPGQYACKERIQIQGSKGSFPSVIVLGPQRPETQVELSLTDALSIGIKAPVRMSGKISGTPGAKLIGPNGEYDIPDGVIIAERHIHMSPEDADKYGVKDGQIVSVKVEGERSLTFHNITLRVSANFATYMHIDYDEANACGFKKGMKGKLIIDD